MSDLPARMLTCAAFIRSRPHEGEDAYLGDVITLLEQGADRILTLEPPEKVDPGETMEILKPLPEKPIHTPLPDLPATFVDPGMSSLPSKPGSNACPRCDSRATKTVRRLDRAFMLECPVCGELWPYTKPSWV